MVATSSGTVSTFGVALGLPVYFFFEQEPRECRLEVDLEGIVKLG